MKLARPLLATALAIALAGCSQFGSSPLEQAQEAFAAQDYITAQEHVQEALAQNADNAEALELLARIQLVMGQGGDVAATLDRLARSGAEPSDANLLAAEGLLQVGDVDEALDLIGNSDSAEAWRLRALAAAVQGDEEGALEAFDEGRSAEGPRGKLFAAEASFHLARGDLDAADGAVALARDVAPDRVETLFVSARLAEAQGEHSLALSNYLRIIEIAPMDRPALSAGIAASERADMPDITRHLILYGAQTRPLDREFVYQRARIDAWDGRWQDVRERLQANEAELEDHVSARLLYAESLLQLGQVETARAIAAPIIARYSTDPDVMRVREAIEAAS